MPRRAPERGRSGSIRRGVGCRCAFPKGRTFHGVAVPGEFARIASDGLGATGSRVQLADCRAGRQPLFPAKPGRRFIALACNSAFLSNKFEGLRRRGCCFQAAVPVGWR
jgi:hypothetical protein